MPNDQFTPPDFNQVRNFNVPQSIDSIINAYNAQKDRKRQEALSNLDLKSKQQQQEIVAQRLAQEQAAVQRQALTDQARYGIAINSITPQEANAAQNPDRSFIGPETSRASQIREGLMRLGQESSLPARKGQAELEKTESDTLLNRSIADANESAGSGLQTQRVGDRDFIIRKSRSGPIPVAVQESTQQREEQKASVKSSSKLAEAKAIEGEVVPEIKRVIELNKNSRGGIAGSASQRIRSGLNIGQDEEFKNTADVINTMKGMVAKVLKSTFGGQLSDGERAYLNEVYGAVDSYSPTEREIAMNNVIRTISSKTREASSVNSNISGAQVPKKVGRFTIEAE